MKTPHKNHTTKRAKSQGQTIRVAELFAGVGGFRIGFKRAGSSSKKFKVVWSNQWEPATKRQHAFEVYEAAFGNEGHSNEDIAGVSVADIPDHDLLVGGFPCQDYSVARTLSQAAGLQGKKGVLWWEIHRIIKEKGAQAPRFLMLENVDRLLKSPASQRGRDFALMLASLSDLGYAVEWRVINAADYGMPQRRRRIYILGYKKKTSAHFEAVSSHPHDWLLQKGLFAKSFPVEPRGPATKHIELMGELGEISEHFNKEMSAATTPFMNAGFMSDRKVWTISTDPVYEGPTTTLGDVLLPDHKVPREYFLNKKEMGKWRYFKNGKKEKRQGKNGFEYDYTEGPIAFPDPLHKPSRTVVTGEGGSTPSRFKHVVLTKSKRHRRLMPVELERLNMFPDNHTKLEGISDVKRAFFMGNALVVGVIEKLGKELLKRAFEPSPPAKRAKGLDSPFLHRAPTPYRTSSLVS